MTSIEGQTDVFELLTESLPIPPFTVNTCVWASGQRCGWCGGKGYDGGGACRNPRNDDESFFYNYCAKCREKHGYPHPGRLEFLVNIDRTQKPRPGDAPAFGEDAA
jgi:hypothetical protein